MLQNLFSVLKGIYFQFHGDTVGKLGKMILKEKMNQTYLQIKRMIQIKQKLIIQLNHALKLTKRDITCCQSRTNTFTKLFMPWVQKPDQTVQNNHDVFSLSFKHVNLLLYHDQDLFYLTINKYAYLNTKCMEIIFKSFHRKQLQSEIQ